MPSMGSGVPLGLRSGGHTPVFDPYRLCALIIVNYRVKLLHREGVPADSAMRMNGHMSWLA